jgi:serine/threonine protein kinase
MSEQNFYEIQHYSDRPEVQRFLTNYKTKKILTGGKYNAVAAGYNRTTRQNVIIKSVYNPDYRKVKEANILKQLHHVPGVIHYLDLFYIKSDVHFIVLEYFGQMTLKKFLITEGAVSENIAYSIFNQIFFTVQACFKKNILHRKTKPSNILINVNTLEIKLTNFNSASQFDEPEFTSQLSHDIAPPEYFYFKNYTADGLYVWSLGLILYELLFNRKPFASPYEIMTKVLTLPWHHQPVSLDVKLFIKWMLDKNKNERITLHQIMHHPWITQVWI